MAAGRDCVTGRLLHIGSVPKMIYCKHSSFYITKASQGLDLVREEGAALEARALEADALRAARGARHREASGARDLHSA